MLAGWGIDFDKGMLTAAFRHCGLEVPFHHRVLDVRSLAFLFHAATDRRAESLSLRDFCLWPEPTWDEGRAHLAGYRVHKTLEALRLISGRTPPAERRLRAQPAQTMARAP